MDDAAPVPESPPSEEEPAAPAGPVLAIFAHPDDMEISAGGTVARWCAEGRAVNLLVLTNGDKGSQDPAQDLGELARTRARETESAAGLLGLASTEILDTPDGFLDNTREVQAEVALRVRRLRPEIVLSCDPTAWFFGNVYFNHSDHRTAGAVALDGIFPGAGNPHFFPEQLRDGLEPWNVHHVWLGWTNEPNHRQDVTGWIDAKLDALDLHTSQVQGDMVGFFREWIPAEAAEHGRQIGVNHAEAFRVLDLG